MTGSALGTENIKVKKTQSLPKAMRKSTLFSNSRSTGSPGGRPQGEGDQSAVSCKGRLWELCHLPEPQRKMCKETSWKRATDRCCFGRVTFLRNGKDLALGLIWEGDMEEGIGQNIPWGTEKCLAEDDYFQWWKWAWAQKLRGLKQGMGREMPTLSDHPGKCVSMYPSECACTCVSW